MWGRSTAYASPRVSQVRGSSRLLAIGAARWVVHSGHAKRKPARTHGHCRSGTLEGPRRYAPCPMPECTNMKSKIAIMAAVVASLGSALAQTTGGSPGGSPSAPAPSTGTRGLSPGATTPPGAPGVTDPRTSTPLPPNAGPNSPDPSTYTNHPGTLPQTPPNQQGPGVTTDPGRMQPGQSTSRPGTAQSANSDGYAECMSMWNPQTNRASREDWSNLRTNAVAAEVGEQWFAILITIRCQ
jgi:hypothetical protein